MVYLMAIIKAAYPEYYSQTNDIRDAVNLWTELLANDDPILIGKAVKEFIKNDDKGFPPKIGQIREMAKTIRRQEAQEERMVEQQKKLNEPQREKTQEEVEMMESAISKMRNILKSV